MENYAQLVNLPILCLGCMWCVLKHNCCLCFKEEVDGPFFHPYYFNNGDNNRMIQNTGTLSKLNHNLEFYTVMQPEMKGVCMADYLSS